jgi:iron(III) transport system ATP-binding protein
MLQMHHLSIRFGARIVLNNFQLAVDPASSLALMGPSGSGKTTLMRLIAGLETPDKGQILLRGRPANGHQLEPHLRGIAMAFQAPALWPHLTVAENVAFGLRGFTSSDRSARVGHLLSRVGLPGLGARQPSELSLGEARRVSLARALAPKAPLLLLDEAFASLDPELRLQCLLLVREEMRAAGATLIHASHDEVEAEVLGSAVLRFPPQSQGLT